jgi:hypothetical protein
MIELTAKGEHRMSTEECWEILDSELNRQKFLIDRLLIAGRLEKALCNWIACHWIWCLYLKESVLAVKPIATKRKVSIRLTSEAIQISISHAFNGFNQANCHRTLICYTSPEGRRFKSCPRY